MKMSLKKPGSDLESIQNNFSHLYLIKCYKQVPMLILPCWSGGLEGQFNFHDISTVQFSGSKHFRNLQGTIQLIFQSLRRELTEQLHRDNWLLDSVPTLNRAGLQSLVCRGLNPGFVDMSPKSRARPKATQQGNAKCGGTSPCQ